MLYEIGPSGLKVNVSSVIAINAICKIDLNNVWCYDPLSHKFPIKYEFLRL